MKQSIDKNEMFQASHMYILICYTAMSSILIGESLLLGWETWALILISIAVVFSWILHIQHKLNERARLWIYSTLMMATFFFYGTHDTSTFDLATVMTPVIILYTMTGLKSLITMCQVTYYLTLTYAVTQMIYHGEIFDSLVITRTLMHVVMIFITGKVAKWIIDKWYAVLNKSAGEIEHLTDATERLNDFLANVSHEIRTPINAVIGLSGICAEKEEGAQVRGDLYAINAAGRRVAEQISDILDYSEIDRRKLATNKEDYMLSSVLNDLMNEIRPYKPDDLELVIDVDPAIPSVMRTDIVKLKKIMRHLIVNGLKYTHEGGVYVRISTVKEPYGVNLCIEVTDTGIGMNPEEVERITERFYQADSGRTRQGGGLGLGMPIVSGFVAALGGFMKLDSKPGVGTTVRVSIPQEVVDETSCMSVADRENLCLGAFLHFEKFPDPHVREYYNVMVRNIVRGLGVQVHRVDNVTNLRKLDSTVKLTHLFVGEEEYELNTEFMELLARSMKVVVVANRSFNLPAGSRSRIMAKPFYCFPVTAVLNEGTELELSDNGIMRCEGVRALVVDDEPMNLTVARSVFGKYGMIVSTASSGQESVNKCSENDYDIVFMDHMMPGMDGVEAMKRIRSDPHRRRNDMPIVALTANAVSSAKEMFLKEGFDGFVSKPIDLVELERVLKKILPKTMITYVEEEEDAIQAEPVSATTEKAPQAAEKTSAPDNSETVQDSGEKTPYEMLEKVGVNISMGLGYCMNDDEFYKSLLIQFAEESDNKRDGMKKALAGDDVKGYEILVHALKSTSKMIGCTELSEKAKALEFAAKEGRRDFIEENRGEVETMYQKLTDTINKAYGTAKPEDGNADDEVMEFLPDDGEEEETDNGVREFAPDGNDGDVLEFLPEDQ